MVPKAGLTKKVSPVEAKKKSVKKRENINKMKKMPGKNNDVNLHLAQRKSFTARKRQRMVECLKPLMKPKGGQKMPPRDRRGRMFPVLWMET